MEGGATLWFKATSCLILNITTNLMPLVAPVGMIRAYKQ